MNDITDMNEKLNCLTPNSITLESTKVGMLDSKTFVAKDLFAVKDHVSSFGNAGWRETHQPSQITASVIANLLESGAQLTGMAKMDQLAYSLIGNVGEGEAPLNSLYPDRYTGGSSSGTASAVAGGLADFGLGTDTAGSIRVPAAACGLYAIRPTHGLLSNKGVLPWARSFDSVSLLAKDAALLQKAFSVLSPLQDTGQSFKRVLLPDNLTDLVTPEVTDVTTETAEKFATQLGCTVERIDFDRFSSPNMTDLFTRLQGRELWQEHHEWIEVNKQYLDSDVVARLDKAKEFSTSPDENKAVDIAAHAKYIADFKALVTSDTVLVLPVTPDLMPKRTADVDELIAFRKALLRLNICASLTGTPEVVLPVTHPESGLTYGVGLISAQNTDSTLLKQVIFL